jgi:hypothetical protein
MKPKAKDVVVSELGNDETVVATPDRSNAVILNALGSAVFDLCDGEHSIDDITAFICQNISAPGPVEVESDVRRIVDELADAGLVELIP